MITIKGQKDFREKVHGVIDGFGGKIEQADNPTRYRITVNGQIINIIDKGTEGILISTTAGEDQVKADPVYNWSDAYTISYLLTLNVVEAGSHGIVFYNKEGESGIQRINSLKTVNKTAYGFAWEPNDRFYDFKDSFTIIALNLVKCGAIHDITCINQEGQLKVSVTGEKALCAPTGIEMLESEAGSGIFPSSEFSGEYAVGISETVTMDPYDSLMALCMNPECQKDSCILGLCGYFEYLYRKGELYDFFLKRKNYKIPCGVFDYSWKPEEGLKKISDATFNTAMALVKNERVIVDFTMTENYQVKFTTRLNLGENVNNDPICSILSDLYVNDCQVKSERYLNIETNFSSITDLFLLTYVCAAYIDYLMKSGQEEQIISDREIYAQNNRGLEKKFEKNFNYSLETSCYGDVSNDEWMLAIELQKQGYVGLKPMIYSTEEQENILGIWACDIVVQLNGELKTLESRVRNGEGERRKHYNNTQLYQIVYHDDINLEEIFRSENWPRMVGIAAFVDYLDMTGQIVGFENRLFARWEKEHIETQKSLESIDSDIVDKVVANPDCDTLYCVIAGEDGTGRKEKAIAIAKKLLEIGKINHFEPIDDVMSFEMAAYKLQHLSNPHEGNISEKVSKSQNGDLITMEDIRSTLFIDDKDGKLGWYRNDYVTEKVNFNRKRIYILTNLRDYLPEIEKAKIGDNSRASHLIECLGKYNKETYIVLVDEKKYIDHLFSIFPQIKYLFGSTIIETNSLSEEEIFENYKENLQGELKADIAADNSYTKRFLDFCARNKKNFAMKNRELAEFLANYSNIHHNPRKMFEAMELYSSKSTDELLDGVIGMDNVKNKVKEFKQYAIYRKYTDNKGMKIPNSNMHMLFTGNPGTGKTMIARIIGQILYDAGIIEENKVIEVEGKDLKGRYVGESGPKTAAKIDEAIGGVLFIDEAYAIGDDTFGKEVIATLIKSMEDRKDQFVVIFAGYPKEMQEFMNINSGINSRIGYKFHFNNYKDNELLKIFNTKMFRAGYKYSDSEEVEKKVLKLCKVFSKKKDFGNGRFIDRVIQQTVIGRATRDYTAETVNIISPEDIPTEEQLLSTDIVERDSYRKQLDAITGLESVKKKIEEFGQYVKFRKEVEESNPQAKIPDSNMHMIFTGNPGTGKTTIARIMVDLLYEVGIIKERKYIEVERKDLVGEHIGKTAIKTGEVIERALNGVLFIDEAYSLAPPDSSNDFGAEAIATLIKAMEDHKGDLVVIFAGYRDEMRRFEKINPGIASRIGYRFDFEDYSCSELIDMFSKKVSGSGFTIDADALARVKTVMDYYRRRQNFGNGRFVSRLWQDTLTKHSSNYDSSTLMKIVEMDIPTIAEMNNTSLKKSNNASLEGVIGLDEVKKQMKVFESWVKFSMDAREKGLKIPATSLHMIFAGNPGTGKTMVARIVAQKLYDLGVIMENKVIEADRSKLVGKYVGETALKTHDVIESAMGGVLFIDEAYMLAEKGTNYNYGAEAVNTLMKVMEDKKDDFVVIFAGYKKEMRDFLAINPGIESRIGYTFNFEDYAPDELLEIFKKKMESYEFKLDKEAIPKVRELFDYFCHVENFGNGRFVDKVIRQTLMNQANNYDFNTMDFINSSVIPTREEMIQTMMNTEKFVMPDSLTEKDKKRVATHEIGHATVHSILRPDIPIKKVTIKPEGDGNLGYVEYGRRANVLATESDYLNEIATALAGLESEKVFYGEYSAGGASDLAMAKDIATRMINDLGMGEISFGLGENDLFSSAEIKKVIDECREKAKSIIEENRNKMTELIDILVTKNSLDGSQVQSCYSDCKNKSEKRTDY